MHSIYQSVGPTRDSIKSVKLFSIAVALIYSQFTSAASFSLGMCTTDPMILTLNNSMLTLADDIGEMADRILTTETYVGDMANRIVETETLLSETLLQLQANTTAGSAQTGARPSVLLLSPSHRRYRVSSLGAGYFTVKCGYQLCFIY
jgi:hypothetical protein